MDWAPAGGERDRAGWGEAWNRRAPVKIPLERSPPPLLASLSWAPGGPQSSSHITFFRPPTPQPVWSPVINDSRCQKSKWEKLLLALQVPKGPGRNFSRQSYSEGTWVDRIRRTPFPCFSSGRCQIASVRKESVFPDLCRHQSAYPYLT